MDREHLFVSLKALGPQGKDYLTEVSPGEKQVFPLTLIQRGAPPVCLHPCCRPYGGCALLDQDGKARRGCWARVVGKRPGPLSVGAVVVILLGPRRCCPYLAFCKEGIQSP